MPEAVCSMSTKFASIISECMAVHDRLCLVQDLSRHCWLSIRMKFMNLETLMKTEYVS